MKKWKSLMLLIAAMVAISGCGGGGGQSGGAVNMVLATGGTSGTYYPFGGAMAQIWNSKIENMNVTAQSTGASAENLRLLDKGEAELAIVQNDVMDYAFNGVASFEGEKLTKFSAIATLYPEVVQIAATPESGIKSVADFAGKRVSVGDAGSGVEFNAKQIMEAYGLTFDDIKKSNLSFKESGEGLQNGTLDACFITAGVPNAALQELATSKELVLISVDSEHAESLIGQYGYYTNAVIPQDAYKGMTEDADSVSIKATLAVNSDVSEDVVYEITKALFENLEELGSAHAKGKEISIEEAVKGISVEIHPGAKKYYEEQGISF